MFVKGYVPPSRFKAPEEPSLPKEEKASFYLKAAYVSGILACIVAIATVVLGSLQLINPQLGSAPYLFAGTAFVGLFGGIFVFLIHNGLHDPKQKKDWKETLLKVAIAMSMVFFVATAALALTPVTANIHVFHLPLSEIALFVGAGTLGYTIIYPLSKYIYDSVKGKEKQKTKATEAPAEVMPLPPPTNGFKKKKFSEGSSYFFVNSTYHHARALIHDLRKNPLLTDSERKLLLKLVNDASIERIEEKLLNAINKSDRKTADKNALAQSIKKRCLSQTKEAKLYLAEAAGSSEKLIDTLSDKMFEGAAIRGKVHFYNTAPGYIEYGTFVREGEGYTAYKLLFNLKTNHFAIIKSQLLSEPPSLDFFLNKFIVTATVFAGTS